MASIYPITGNAKAFLEANLKSPVIRSRHGGRYVLDDGTEFTLDRDEVEMIGLPRWKL